MQITSVHYSHLVNLGNYENQKFAAWAQVEEGETPETALATLKSWVENQAGISPEAQAAESQAERLERRLQQARYDMQRMQTEFADCKRIWEKGRDFLKAMGLDLPRNFMDVDRNPFVDVDTAQPVLAGDDDDEEETDGPPF